MQRNSTGIKVQKNGFLYIHYCNWDALEQIIGFNAKRILRQKTTYPVLVPYHSNKEKLLNLRNSLLYALPNLETFLCKDFYYIKTMILSTKIANLPGIGLLSNVLKRILIHMGLEKQIETSTQIQKAIYMAAQSMEVRIGLSHLGASDKLYLLGHGSAELWGVGDGSSNMEGCVTMQEYAEKLKKAKLSSKIRDIRALWCESGNHVVSTSSTNESTDDPAETFNRQLTPAQMLSLELTSLGYQNITVSGYKGIDPILPSDYDSSKPRYFTTREIKTSVNCSNKESWISLRSSTVRKTYLDGLRVKSSDE